MDRELGIPGCLGQITKWHSEYCSTECSMAALCVLLVMGSYLQQGPGVPPFPESQEHD